MFNSLNSTGMPLSDADIISAQLYSNAKNEERDTFKKNWEQLCADTDELARKNIVTIDSVLQEYMYIKRSIDKHTITKNGNIDVTTPGLRNYYTVINKNLLKKPLSLCEELNKIVKIWKVIKDYPIIQMLLRFNENAKLYLISYLYRYEIEDINKKVITSISECILRLFTVLELVDSGYSSNNFKTFLFGENVKLVDKAVSFNEIIKDFDEHIKKTWKEDSLNNYIMDYERNVLVYLNEYLYWKEKYSENKKNKFVLNGSANVEHIMPASGRNIDLIRLDAGINSIEEFNEYVNKIGNKILLEEDINKSISNEWFKTKKQSSITDKRGYKNSGYSIARDLVNYPSDLWTKDDIDNATNKAASRIIKFIYRKKEEKIALD